jgi:hypothetical protein
MGALILGFELSDLHHPHDLHLREIVHEVAAGF